MSATIICHISKLRHTEKIKGCPVTGKQIEKEIERERSVVIHQRHLQRFASNVAVVVVFEACQGHASCVAAGKKKKIDSRDFLPFQLMPMLHNCSFIIIPTKTKLISLQKIFNI